jgi:hypothetical protein
MTMDEERNPAGTVRQGNHKLTVSLPAQVVRQLKQRMVAEETTIRALLLEALHRAGYAVPAAEIRDRRKREAA